MKKYAVISGDIVSSTSLGETARVELYGQLEKLVLKLMQDFDCYARISKGDYIECVCRRPSEALRIALIIKSYIKSLDLKVKKNNSRTKNFSTHGLRMAIGYGELGILDTENDIIDGQAIFMAGRKINAYSSHNKERVVLKQTTFFVSEEEQLNFHLSPNFALLDVLCNKATAKQSEVLYFKLQGMTETEIAEKLGVSQSVINQHSTALGWNAIEESVEYYKNIIKQALK
ncbi:hypothetical protein GCM10007049_04980 [Echinicola pacifica]|uniref:Fumarate hydratase n=1 Tax=Echinicola pacifica TaxID=346377 RepID=A0A918UK68_9BACT|nr:hypothetical protein [Echinicola pacifica]GGZ15787.1 hypothetical protein GCM10007049_04980 [Echinicola pacifica]